MSYSTNSFLDDDELFSMFAIDRQPQLQRSKLFKLNISNGLVELLGIKGNILAFRKLAQSNNRVLIRLDVDPLLDIEDRLHKLGFTLCSQSTRAGFNEFQPVVSAPNGYTQQCDPIPTIWRSWWSIANQTLNGRAVVLVFHEGQWLDVQKIETGVNPTIFTKLPELEICKHTAVHWAIDTRQIEVKKAPVAAPANQSPLNFDDERSWLQERSVPKGAATMSQTLKEITTIGNRWLTNINSLQDNCTDPTTEASAIEQRKSQIVKTLKYLLALSQEQP
jgi:hypothetical protein